MVKKNLIYAAMTGDLAAVREVLDDGADPNALYVRGMTALMAASMVGHEEIVRELLEHGADPNGEYETGGTALMFAAGAGHAGTVGRSCSRTVPIRAQSSKPVKRLWPLRRMQVVPVSLRCCVHMESMSMHGTNGGRPP